jgi:hypothetical protein
VIPWTLDLDRMEEDFFLRLGARAARPRTLSLDGARMSASELRDAVPRRHAAATARVGRSDACPFDLHALVPVPADVLRLGPDHPDALQWLWTHWGTTQALRHVVGRSSSGASRQAFAVSFWAADWTPWRALATVRAGRPTLRIDLRKLSIRALVQAFAAALERALATSADADLSRWGEFLSMVAQLTLLRSRLLLRPEDREGKARRFAAAKLLTP